MIKSFTAPYNARKKNKFRYFVNFDGLRDEKGDFNELPERLIAPSVY